MRSSDDAAGATLLSTLAGIPGLYADPVTTNYDPPYFDERLAELAEPFWAPCTASSAAPTIPNEVHQPWLHGATPRWEHILGMLSARFVLRPDRYTLYYNRPPPPSPQWRCACVFATCVQRRASSAIPFRQRGTGRTKRIKAGHWPELMRYDLLLEHGGIFLDHDSYVLRPLDGLRRCCAQRGVADERRGCEAPAAVVAGFEQEPNGVRKLNPGLLMSERGATFLQLMRASWHNYSSGSWDYNCCQVAFRIHEALPQLRSFLSAGVGPLPRYATEVQYDAHLSRASVVHVTALSQPWRKSDDRRFGIMHKVAMLVIERAVNGSSSVSSGTARGGKGGAGGSGGGDGSGGGGGVRPAIMSREERECFEQTAAQVLRRHPPPEPRRLRRKNAPQIG
jgi:hypothetical protein